MVAPFIASAGATAGRGLAWLLKNLVGKGSQLGVKDLSMEGKWEVWQDNNSVM